MSTYSFHTFMFPFRWKIKGFDDPIVIKPSLCAGSQGTTKARKDQTEIIRDAFEICKGFSRNRKVTIEEYVEMPSMDVIEGDIFVMEDEILWDGIFTTRRSAMAPMIPMTYIFPAILKSSEKQVSDMDSTTWRCISRPKGNSLS